MNPELETLKRMLSAHDWHHEFSDDHQVWQRGWRALEDIRVEQRRLVVLGLATQEQVQDLYNLYAPG